MSCNNAECAVPANECCNVGSGATATNTCLASTATCSGNKQECDEAADCTGGQVCCLVTNVLTSAFTISCKATCATGLGSAQLCTTNAECAGHTCSVWSCQGQQTEACESPAAGICTMVGQAIDLP